MDTTFPQPTAEESQLVFDLYRALIESANLPYGLAVVLETVCRATGWVLGTAWLPSADQEDFRLFASWHPNDVQLELFVERCRQEAFRRDVGIVGRAWHRAEAEWTSNLAAEPVQSFPLAPLAAKAGLKAAFAVPVTGDGVVEAVLVFHVRELKEADANLRETISRVASQIGFALRHKRLGAGLATNYTGVTRKRDSLEEQVARRSNELSLTNELLHAEIAAREQMEDELAIRLRQQRAVAELSQQALSGAELFPLMQALTELAAKTLNVEFCKVLQLLPDKQSLRLVAGVGWASGLVGRATVSVDKNSQAGYTLFSREPVIVVDLAREKRFSGPSLLRAHAIVSGVSVIIGPAERPFGVLGAHTTTPRSFTQNDIDFLQSAANVLFQIIERDRALTEVSRQATWLERLIETTQDAVISIDRRGCVVLFNAAAERVFGYGAQEIIGRKVNDLMAEPYASEHDQYIARYETTGEARAIGRIRTVEGRRKNGEVFPIELSVTQIATGEGEEVLYAAFIRDISEVRRGQAWLQSLIETTQDAVLSIDRQGRIVLFNPAAERIFGYTRSEVSGQKVNMLMAEPYASEHDEYIARYETSGEARAIGRIRTVTARRRDGELFPIELSVAEIAVDKQVHYAAFIRDISEKTRLQAQLVESERFAAIGSTAAKIGHELANPLNGMSLTIQLLVQRVKRLGAEAERQLSPTVKRLRDEIARLQKLVSEFGSISRKERYVFRPISLVQLIEDVIALQSPHLSQNGIEMQTSLAADLPVMNIDGDKMKQALLNLIKNAGEAMPHGGRLGICAVKENNTVIVEITDTGEGIPVDIDAFKPFVTTKKEGSGIGLVVVRQILMAHDGTISYRSRVGEGTTFRLELPQK